MQSIGIWGLREEARESWDHAVSNEVIYLGQSSRGNLEVSHTFAEKYLKGELWFEGHFTAHVRQQRETHFQAIIEVADELLPLTGRSGHSNRKHSGVSGDRSMLVHFPEFVQLPEQVIPVGITSEVRLKIVEDFCHCGWKKAAPIFVSGVPLFKDQETNIPTLFIGEDSSGVEMGESPSQPFQGRSETRDKFPEEQGDYLRDGADIHPKDVETFFKLCVFPDHRDVWQRKPFANFYIKSVKVMLRPVGFHINFEHDITLGDRHVSESSTECGTINA